MRHIIWAACLAFFIMMIQGQPASAANDSEDHKQFVKKAFEAQVSLSEKGRSMEEIQEILKPYFTREMIDLFIEENVVAAEDGYQTFGSDFALYYIPFFSYSDETKIVEVQGNIYVAEFFGDHEGPVSYGSDYLGVRLTNEGGNWKVADILGALPDTVQDKLDGTEEEMFWPFGSQPKDLPAAKWKKDLEESVGRTGTLFITPFLSPYLF